MLFLTKFIEKVNLRRYPYEPKKYFVIFFINSGLMFIGFTIDLIIHFLFIAIFSKHLSTIKSKSLIDKSLYKDSNILLIIFVICIIEPISEEIVFRKFLIDRLALYSKKVSIFLSGLIYGISHRNLQQFFGTMFSGWVYAYSYVETNNILIPISYHIIENSITVIKKIKLIKSQTKSKNGIFMRYLRLIECIFGIILLIKYRNNIKVSGENNNSKDKWKLYKSYGMWIFIIEGIIISFILYLKLFF